MTRYIPFILNQLLIKIIFYLKLSINNWDDIFLNKEIYLKILNQDTWFLNGVIKLTYLYVIDTENIFLYFIMIITDILEVFLIKIINYFKVFLQSLDYQWLILFI